jgi:hypothetical protein
MIQTSVGRFGEPQTSVSGVVKHDRVYHGAALAVLHYCNVSCVSTITLFDGLASGPFEGRLERRAWWWWFSAPVLRQRAVVLAAVKTKPCGRP